MALLFIYKKADKLGVLPALIGGYYEFMTVRLEVEPEARTGGAHLSFVLQTLPCVNH